MALVTLLELEPDFLRLFREEAALSRERVGVDRLVLEPEGDVQHVDVPEAARGGDGGRRPDDRRNGSRRESAENEPSPIDLHRFFSRFPDYTGKTANRIAGGRSDQKLRRADSSTGAGGADAISCPAETVSVQTA